MSLLFLPQNINIKIYIPVDEIDNSDLVNIYEYTDSPSDAEWLGTVKSGPQTLFEDVLNPSAWSTDPSNCAWDENPSENPSAECLPIEIHTPAFTTEVGTDYYKFEFSKAVTDPGNYTFYYTVKDVYGNEGDIERYFDIDVCLVPRTPDLLDYDTLDFNGNTSITDIPIPTIVQYKMNDIAGTTVTDSQNYRTGTQSNAISSVAGKINTAIEYNGVDDFTTVEDFTDIDESDFSVSFWMKTTDTTSSNIVSKVFFLGPGTSVGWHIRFASGNFGMSINKLGNGAVILGSETYNDGDWVFVTFTVDRGGLCKIYKNGVFDNSEDISGIVGSLNIQQDPSVEDINVYLGCLWDTDPGNTTRYLNGSLDNVCIFDKVLTQEEIDFLYNSGDGTESIGEEYYTIYHYPEGSPSVLEEDGKYFTDTTTFGLDTPDSDDSYNYFRTATSLKENCDETSDDSTNISVEVVGGSVVRFPYTDPTNLNVVTTAAGKFILDWNYTVLDGDPIDNFNIYFSLTYDPSADEYDWQLDGDTNYSNQTNKFSYDTVTSTPDGTTVYFKVVPVVENASVDSERDNTLIESGVSDDLPPDVLSDIVEITLQ